MTPTQAATSYALSFKNHLSTADQERLKEAFTKGLEWAVADPDVLREILKPFAEWVQYQSIQNPEQAVKGYLQHLQTIKQKEDGK